MIINRTFDGKMNLDAQPFRVPKSDYIDALNITRDAEGEGQDLVVSNVKGNQLVNYTLPDGFNKVIGFKEDKVRNRVYYWIWNSNDNDLILYYDATTGTIVKLIENLTDSGDVDILGFDPSEKITDIDILYKDSADEDEIYYTDSLSRPSLLELGKILNGDYGTLIRSFINVSKEPPSVPPTVAYQDDITVTVNNLKKRLFKFKSRFVFANGMKSVWSAHSIMPIPSNYGDTNADADPTINAFISVEIPTGEINITKLEIAGCVSLGNTYSDFFLIDVLDKETLSIADNSTTTFNFYNEKAYNYVDILESIQPFDVLDKARRQCMPNGNVLTYGAITEGYDNLTSLGDTVAAATSAMPDTPIQPAYDWWSRFSFGLQYFDGEGRAVGGVQTDDSLSVQSIAYDETSGVVVPQFDFQIWHRPPEDAEYFHWVRTKNLTKSNILQWVSDRTFKDDSTEPDNYRYAFISIENLNTFITNNPSTALGYEFKTGDRVRFIKLFASGGRTDQVVEENKDFEIQSVVVNPSINGIVQDGTFLKIILPTVDANFDFGVQTWSPYATDINYYNYLIEMYTPAQQVANGLDVYYEFGERYEILDAGTDDRRHAGQTQDQSADLLTPALYSFDDGDYYYRERTVKTGAELEYQVQSSASSDGRITLGVNFISSTYDDSNILTGNSPFQDLIGFNASTNEDRYLLKVLSGTYTFRIKGAISVEFVGFAEHYKWFLTDSAGTVTELVPLQIVNQGSNVFTFDKSFQLSSTGGADRIFILGSSSNDNDNSKNYFETNITITRELDFTQGIIDPNFSDYYPSAVNQNGRAWAIQPNSKRVYNPVLVRFGQEYQPGTDINGLNRFYEDNFDEYDRSFGDITKLFIEKRYMYVFQKFDVGVVPVLTQIVKDTAGNPLEANSDQLLNKIAYPYAGKYGIGNVPESFAYGKGAMYWLDNNKGVVCRLSNDGIIPLSILYECNAFFVSNSAAYNSNLNNGNGASGEPYMGNPTVYGVFNQYTNKYIIAMEEINRYDSGGNLIFHQDANTLIFNEVRNQMEGFETKASFAPEMMGCLNNLLIAFKDGELWTHDSDTYCNFFGVQYDAYVTAAFNDSSLEKKTWSALTQISNTIWTCPVMYTNVSSYAGQRQETRLIEQDFEMLEQYPSAPILRDSNSIGGTYDGDWMKGGYMVIRFLKQNASSLAILSGVSVLFKDSALTAR